MSNKKASSKTKNAIGLSKSDSKKLAKKLNELLANYSIFYQNTRGYHWNIKGRKFFELHEKFEELYNDSKIKIDEIAERILTLGVVPMHTYSDYVKHASIDESRNISDGDKAIETILDSYKVILPLERELLDLSGDSGDEGTSALMSDYISEQEKLIWMYTSYLTRN